jgi:hypothetical protein
MEMNFEEWYKQERFNKKVLLALIELSQKRLLELKHNDIYIVQGLQAKINRYLELKGGRADAA